MGKLIISANAPFAQKIFRENFTAVSAGAGTVCALRPDGTTFYLTTAPETALRHRDWTDMAQIALSPGFSNMAIGLQRDGKCMIGKGFLRSYLEGFANRPRTFDAVNGDIRALESVKKVVADDAFAALTHRGTVQVIHMQTGFSGPGMGTFPAPQYYDCADWENITDIDMNASHLIGITKDGALLETHFPSTRGPNATTVCDAAWQVRQACIVGMDPPSAAFSTARNELWLTGLQGAPRKPERLPFPENETAVKLVGLRNTLAVLTASGKLYVMTDACPGNFRVTEFEHIPGFYRDVALGAPTNHFPVFLCAIEGP